jgi:hypothetical protein
MRPEPGKDQAPAWALPARRMPEIANMENPGAIREEEGNFTRPPSFSGLSFFRDLSLDILLQL